MTKGLSLFCDLDTLQCLNNEYIKMGSCAFQCDVTHQYIAQRQVGLCL